MLIDFPFDVYCMLLLLLWIVFCFDMHAIVAVVNRPFPLTCMLLLLFFPLTWRAFLWAWLAKRVL